MAKALKKQNKRLKARQERHDKINGRGSKYGTAGYTRPGSMNKKKGS